MMAAWLQTLLMLLVTGAQDVAARRPPESAGMLEVLRLDRPAVIRGERGAWTLEPASRGLLIDTRPFIRHTDGEGDMLLVDEVGRILLVVHQESRFTPTIGFFLYHDGLHWRPDAVALLRDETLVPIGLGGIVIDGDVHRIRLRYDLGTDSGGPPTTVRGSFEYTLSELRPMPGSVVHRLARTRTEPSRLRVGLLELLGDLLGDLVGERGYEPQLAIWHPDVLTMRAPARLIGDASALVRDDRPREEQLLGRARIGPPCVAPLSLQPFGAEPWSGPGIGALVPIPPHVAREGRIYQSRDRTRWRRLEHEVLQVQLPGVGDGWDFNQFELILVPSDGGAYEVALIACRWRRHHGSLEVGADVPIDHLAVDEVDGQLRIQVRARIQVDERFEPFLVAQEAFIDLSGEETLSDVYLAAGRFSWREALEAPMQPLTAGLAELWPVLEAARAARER